MARIHKHPYLLHEIFVFLGLGCLIVGIVGEGTDRCVGLEPFSWYLLAIAALVGAVAAAVMTLVDTTKEK